MVSRVDTSHALKSKAIGLQWSNLYTSPVSGDEFNVGGAMFMLIVDAVIYGVLTWYIEAVFPGVYAINFGWRTLNVFV